MSLFAELKRRNVVRVGAAYLAVAWLIVQIVETLFPVFGVGERAIRVIVILLGIGFLPVVAFAWFFEWTPEGIRPDAEVDHDDVVSRRATRRVDRLLVVVLALAVGFFTFDKFILDPGRDIDELEAARTEAREEGRVEAMEQIREASIAVLPFEDLSATGDQQFFCDGLAQDILNDLSRIAQLHVTARTSAFSFRGTGATIAEIGEKLNVAHVLEGSVTKAGDKIRIAVQLADTRSETTLWSEEYDRPLHDIFDVRDDISERVVAYMPIRARVTAGASQRTDPKAYGMTLRARASRNSAGANAMEAKGLLEQALAIDPNYVPALIELIYVNYGLVYEGLLSADEDLRIYEEISQRIFNRDPDNGMALAMQAGTSWEVENNWEAAAEEFSVALAAEPGNVEVLRLAGVFARRAGKPDAAVALLEKIAALDPLYLPNLFQLGQAYLSAGRYEDANDWFRRQERLSGGSTFYLGIALLFQGRPEEALAALDAAERPRDRPQGLALRTMIMHDLGKEAQRDEALGALVDVGMDQVPYSPYLVAEAYAWIGDYDIAFAWIHKGLEVDERYGVAGWWFRQILFLPVWGNLHDDPRWESVRERVGMSAERMDAIEFDPNDRQSGSN